MSAEAGSYVAECFWPDVDEEAVRKLDERIHACIADSAGVRYLGSILIRDDDVVLCQFEGRAVAVREVAERARVPFERLLQTSIAVPETAKEQR